VSGDRPRPLVRPGPELRSERLLLRRWQAEELEPCAEMNADPQVMEHLPRPYSRAESAAFIAQMEHSFDEHGYGLWALELIGEAPFVGCVGLLDVRHELPFAPAIEIGWRLARPWWGRGFATEAASAVVAHAFGKLALRELVAYTARRNERSRRVMQRLGMRHDADEDFCHPALAAGDPLAPHVLYRLQGP
jgi:RimJ/RimL family protein N-acetyltransferase